MVDDSGQFHLIVSLFHIDSDRCMSTMQTPNLSERPWMSLVDVGDSVDTVRASRIYLKGRKEERKEGRNKERTEKYV